MDRAHTFAGAFSLVMALVVGGSVAHAEVYRWKDSSGQVHFGDRPDATSRGVQKVVVPRPNLAEGFEVTPPTTSASPTQAQPIPSGVPEAVVPKPEPVPKLGVAARRKDSCKAKWAAFEASAACFGACGKNNGGGKTRNNAGCEHCDEAPMPNC